MNSTYDVFISYRRENGEYTAKLIYDRLTSAGYKVFFDVESMRSGDFNEELYSVIDTCTDIIVVLPPCALDRSVTNPDKDWLYKELTYAYSSFKRRFTDSSPESHVIPVLMRDFVFPDNLPDDLSFLPRCNGITASNEYFDASIEKLMKFLHASKDTSYELGVIRLINSKPAYTADNFHPDTEFSDTVNINQYSAIVFNVKLCSAWGSTEDCVVNWAVYDDKGRCIYSKTTTFGMKPEYDQMFFSLSIKSETEKYGAGDYRAVFSIKGEESTYKFRIVDFKAKKPPVCSLIGLSVAIIDLILMVIGMPPLVQVPLLLIGEALAITSLFNHESKKALAIIALIIIFVTPNISFVANIISFVAGMMWVYSLT